MEMISMKRDQSDDDEAMIDSPDENVYPWGLSLHLGEDELEKLGVDNLPDVGKTMEMMVRVEVTSVSQHEDKSDDGSRRNVELQITDIGMDAPKKDRAAIMFGGEGGDE